MQTPAGKECRFYHADFHRGRNLQECRLIKHNMASMAWKPSDCTRCPVPDILNANASPHLELELTIKPRMLGFGRQHVVSASCLLHRIPIEDPFVGCLRCLENRPGLDLFRQALEQVDDESDSPTS